MKKDIRIKNVVASLYDLSQLVKEKSTGLEKELKRARVLIQRAFDFNLFTVFQYDYLERKLVPMHMYGDPFNLVDAVNFRLGKGATQWCIHHKRPLLIKDLSREDGSERFFVNSFLAVPIIINAQIVGAVVMGDFEKSRYTDADRFMMEIISPYLGNLLMKSYLELEKEDAA